MLTFSIPAGQAANWANDCGNYPFIAEMEGAWWNQGEDLEHYYSTWGNINLLNYGDITNGQPEYRYWPGVVGNWPQVVRLLYDSTGFYGVADTWTLVAQWTGSTKHRDVTGVGNIEGAYEGFNVALDYPGGWYFWTKNSTPFVAFGTSDSPAAETPLVPEKVRLVKKTRVSVCGPALNIPTGLITLDELEPGFELDSPDLPEPADIPTTIPTPAITLIPIDIPSETPLITHPQLENNGGGEGDPHCEGFDRPFDFHGKSGRCYQMYKGDKLRINIKMSHAYHCVENGTFISEIYVSGTQNGKGYEALWAVNGVADVSGVFKSIPLPNKPLLGAYAKDVSEFKNGNWVNTQAVEINDDTARITLTRSRYLGQWCVNFRITVKIIEEKAKGIIGQTWNMKLRLPNELFEVEQINSEDIMRVITPDMYFPVEIGVK